MYSSFNKSLTEFTYLIERISIVTKEFLNKLDKKDKLYNLIYKIYKSNQSINYEFIKLCYNIRTDGKINIDIPDIKNIDIQIENIKTIWDYKNFIKSSSNSIRNPLNFICKSSEKYSLALKREIDNFKLLIANLEAEKIS